MHFGFRSTIVGLLLLLSAGVVMAREPLTLSTDQPGTFDDVKKDVSSVQSYLEKAQCGGYNMEEPMAGKVATLASVPGRPSDWGGNVLSGMGTRVDVNDNKNSDDDFRFPTTTVGLTTACESGRDQIQKGVWRRGGTRPDEIVQQVITYPNPYFQDPSCRWRVKVNGQFSETAPHIPLQDNETISGYGELDQSPNDRQSPTVCNNFCAYLNTWQYQECMEVTQIPDPNNPDQLYPICVRWAAKYLCTDQEVRDAAGACAVGSTEPANSIACTGQSCRCSEDGGPALNGCKTNPGTQLNEAPVYYSYARRYDATVTRDAVPSDGPADNTLGANAIPIACYGFYNEFDPKFHQTEEKDRRCVIDVDVSEMRESQIGKGSIGDSSKTIDLDPVEQANQRTKTASAKDVWYMKLGLAFSLLNEKSFKDDYQKNLSQVYIDTDSLDDTKLTGSWPVSNQTDQRLAKSDTLRSFDDTGDKRTVVSWWQKQQTEVATVLHPPVVRLLLPATYAFSADPTDPLFSLPKTVGYDPYDKRTKRMEVQIDAQEDTLGQIVKAIERSLILHLEEDPIPVLVPSGSPTEYRARAEAWCTWYMQKENVQDCSGAPEDITKLINRLNEYADRIEEVRALRGVLATYAAKILEMQQQLRNPIQEWITKNLAGYRAYIAKQQELSQGIASSWREAQEAMKTFANKTNLPWCMNQRFTSPIYSLLDDWLPARKDGGSLTADDMPNLTIPRTKDIVVDFSGMSTFTGSVALPVLKPIQVTINIPSPPSILDGAKIEKELPALPSIADVQNALDQTLNQLPKVKPVGSFPDVTLPVVDENILKNAPQTIAAIKDKVDKMNERYDKFWKSIGPLSKDDTDTSRDGIKTMKENLECKSWDDPLCQHVEMDLMERLQRIASRKMVFLNADYESSGMRRGNPDACLPEDPACNLVHGETTSTYRWQIDGPQKSPDLGTEARSRVRDLIFPFPIGRVNEDDMPPYDVDIPSILPAFDVPRPIDLFPIKTP